MIAISTAGCRSSTNDYTAQLYQRGLFKNFEYMAEDSIFLQDLMSIVSICAQPELVKSNSGHSLCARAENDRKSYLLYLANKASIATQNKCRNIVIWPGYIPTTNGFEKNNELLHNNQRYSYSEKEKQSRTPYLQNLCRSLFHLCKNFPQLNFCIPPARTFYEIPLFPYEVEWILEDVRCNNLKYWHNTSSCYFLEKLGLQDKESWLETLGNHTQGVHLEDVVQTTTMCPPGTGEIDFKSVKSNLPQNVIKVLRISEEFGEFGIKTALDLIN